MCFIKWMGFSVTVIQTKCITGFDWTREFCNRFVKTVNYVRSKVARRPRAPRTFLEFAIKAGFALDLSTTFCCLWIFSGVLESSWTDVKLFIIVLLITLNIQESRLNNVIEQNNVHICSNLKQLCINKYPLSFSNVCLKKYATPLCLKSIQSRHD